MRATVLNLSTATAIGLVLAGYSLTAAQAQDLPPNAVPGHCYGKMIVPEEYQTYSEQIIDHAARTETRIIPAVMGEQLKTIVEREARTEYRTIPATYRTVTETVIIKPETVRRVTIPAQYGEVTEQVLVREAHTVWKRGAVGPGEVIVTGSNKVLATGEVLCLVQVPAEYKTITRQVVRTPETTREVVDAAVTSVVTRQVIDQPARVVEEHIPAVTKTVRVSVVTQPERTQTIDIPATYRTVSKQRLVSQSHFEWRDVQCQPESGPPNTALLGVGPQPQDYRPSGPGYRRPSASASATRYSSNTVRYDRRRALARGGDSGTQSLQMALSEKGYYTGPFSGRFTSATQLAMVRYQRAQGLPVGNYDAPTARKLGLN